LAKLKRHLRLTQLVEIMQAGLVTFNTTRAFETIERGGYFPSAWNPAVIVQKGVENFGQSKNGATVNQIEKYVNGSV